MHAARDVSADSLSRCASYRAHRLPATPSLPCGSPASRKSFIGHVLGDADASGPRRMWGTAATSAIAVQQGANFIRVHDVIENKDVIVLSDAVYKRQ